MYFKCFAVYIVVVTIASSALYVTAAPKDWQFGKTKKGLVIFVDKVALNPQPLPPRRVNKL